MDRLRTLVEKNEGLLFVIASEVFFTLMQTSAKLLEETGVSVLEVSYLPDAPQCVIRFFSHIFFC